MTPEYIVIHTAAFTGRNCDADRIDSWHRDRGWNGIGYHYVILNDRHSTKPDGLVEKGRDDSRSGAHARGLNGRSLGICCIGHGDIDVFTDKQNESLKTLVNQLMQKYGIPIDKVIGHRELNVLADKGVIEAQYRTSKSCPGKLIDMDDLRTMIAGESASEDSVSNTAVRDAITVLQEHSSLFPNAMDELNAFVYHPEVIALKEGS